MKSGREVKLVAVILAAVLPLAACGGSDGGGGGGGGTSTLSEASSLDELYKAAVDAGESTVTIYGSAETQWAPVYKEFMKAYPKITIVGDPLRPAETDARLDQENASGQHTGDLVHTDDVIRWGVEGRLQPMAPIGAKDLPADVKILDGLVWNTSFPVYGFMYNTDRVKPDEVPKGWSDFVDAKWQGRIGMASPTDLGATSTVLKAALDNKAIDENWIAQLRKLSPKVYPNTIGAFTGVATGESDITPVGSYGFYQMMKKDKAPVGFVVPVVGGHKLSPYPYGLLKNAPSPNAARLLVSWLFTHEGQLSITTHITDYGSVDPEARPAGLPTLAELKKSSWPDVAPDKFAAVRQEGVKEMKRLFG